MTTIEDLLLFPDARREGLAPAKVDPLRERGALLEAQVLDVRQDVLGGGDVGVIFELRQALQLREANTGVLVARKVDELTTSGLAKPNALWAWSVVESRPVRRKGALEMRLALWCSHNARLTLRAAKAEFFVGNVPGLDDAPPDYPDVDRSTVRGRVADWNSDFELVGATFFDVSD